MAVLINGYHFGTFDQVFHITFLKKFVTPDLYPHDPFLSLRWYHFSYFWFPFIALYKAQILEISMFLIHIMTVYGTIWMFWALSDLLFSDESANLLVTCALIFPHLGLPGFQIIEFSLLNRSFVLPFLLGSIWLYLKDRRMLAFILVGAMFNLHVIYAAFVTGMFLLNEGLTFSKNAWWKPISRVGAFLLFSLPVLIWRSQTGSGIDLSLRPEMLDLAARSLLFTVYYPIAPISFVIGNLLAGIGTLWGFILGFRQTPNTEKHQTVRNFVFAIGILLLIAVLTSYLFPITVLLQMQLLRAGVFMLYFGMLFLSYFLCSEFKRGQITASDFSILTLIFVITITPLIPILFWVLVKKFQTKKWQSIGVFTGGLIVLAVSILAASQSGLWAPGFHIYGPRSAWRDVQDWARENTPIDTMFITPPHLFGHYIPDWRVFSERSTVASIPELMEIPFDPEFSESIQFRLEAVAPGAIASFDGNYMHSIKKTGEAFYTNSLDDFKNIGCNFSAEYLVMERGHPLMLERVYQNDEFIVYRLPPCP